jgi:PAS domain S-box-containing protein
MTEQEHAAQYARSLIEATLDPLVTISAEGKIADVNEATVEVTGVSRDKLIGSNYAQYVTEPDRAIEGYQQVFQQGSVTDYPLTARHQDGTLTDLLCHASVYRDRSGNVLGVLAIGHVVTKPTLRQREIAQP